MDSYIALLLVPVGASILFWSATLFSMLRFRLSAKKNLLHQPAAFRPTVSVIKPVCGLEKNLYANLMSVCRQTYRPYEVLFTLHSQTDPAARVIEAVKHACPKQRIRVIVDERRIGANGKISNLQNGIRHADGQVVVVSDSDMYLAPDAIVHLVAPLQDPGVGIACTLYRARRPENLWEVLVLLSYNVDFVPSMVFAYVTGASVVCPGASMAIRRETLEAVGGLFPLRNYFVEDYELARRAAGKGFRIALAPYAVNMEVEVRSGADWWRHQVSWDLKTRSANRWGYVSTLLLRGIPFALFYAIAGGPHAWKILAATGMFRITTAVLNARLLGDTDGLRHVWLLPVRDLLGLGVWVVSLFKRKTRWRGETFFVKKGKLEAVRGNTPS